VTGCKLAPQGLPAVKREVTSAAQAAADSFFFANSGNGNMYETTTMEDCCRPSCASMDWISGRGLVTDAEYNAFYSCDPNGVPITE
jgi:aspartate oxidase